MQGLPLDESYLLQQLPDVPPWFRDELSRVATRNGHPVFRLVDGLRERKWRNGKWDIKHLLQIDADPPFPPYQHIYRMRFRRKHVETGEERRYLTWAEADAEADPGYQTEIESAVVNLGVMAIGRPCWIVEVYVAPEEVDEATWESQRYDMLEKHGIVQKIDLLGPFPRDGYYMACFDVVRDGIAISPNQGTIDECKRRWRIATTDTETVEQAIQGAEAEINLFEKTQLQRLNDGFFQHHGIVAHLARSNGVMGKPIRQQLASAARN